MKTESRLPLAKCAYDDPVTRGACERIRRRARISLLCRVGGWLAVVVVAIAVETDAQLVEGLASFLTIPGAFLLAGPAKVLRWMSAVEVVLKSHPWQHCVVTAEREVRSTNGTPVQLDVVDQSGDTRGSSVMAARTWRLGKPRAGLLTDGAWFAGDPQRGGVIAWAGGRPLATVRRP